MEIKLEGVQLKKVIHLLERGYRVESAKILMASHEKCKLCTIDTYGRVDWWNGDEDETVKEQEAK